MVQAGGSFNSRGTGSAVLRCAVLALLFAALLIHMGEVGTGRFMLCRSWARLCREGEDLPALKDRLAAGAAEALEQQLM